MTRGTWAAVLLLLGTNAAWAIAWWSGDGRPEEPVGALRAEAVPGASDAAEAAPGAGEDVAPVLGGAARPPAVREGSAASEGGPVGPAPREDPSGDAPDGPMPMSEAEKAHYAQVRERMLAVLRRIMQVRDPAEREAGLRELGEALGSTDPVVVEMGLGTLHALRGVEVDRAQFRELVLDQLHAASPGVRRSALYALHATGAVPEDVRFALAAVRDESVTVRQHAARVLDLYTGGRFEGEAAQAVLALLADPAPPVRSGCLSAMAGARVDASVERALLAMARRPAERDPVIRSGLAPLEDKSRAVIDVLFEALVDEDQGLRARAHWGLQRGVPEPERAYVARRYVEQLDRFVNPQTHREVLRIVALHGDASLIPALERFAANELVEARVREGARKVIEHLRSK